MASILNIGQCGLASTLNTGVPFCDVLRDRPAMAIYLDQGKSFTPSDLATAASFLAALTTATRAVRGVRAFPIPNLKNFTDNTPDPTTGGVGNLDTKTRIVDDPTPDFTFAVSGGELYQKKLQGLEVGVYDVMIVDRKGVVYGRTNSSGNFQGFSVYENYVYVPKFLGTDAVEQYRFKTTLSSFQEYKSMASFVVVGAGIFALTGINNVVVSLFSQTTNVGRFTFVADGGKDLAALYATEILVAANITATNAQTGAPITVTSRTLDATTTPNQVVITIDSTAYAALASGDKININLAIPSVLKTNGIDGFESTGAAQMTKA